jgi:hypothetical protein
MTPRRYGPLAHRRAQFEARMDRMLGVMLVRLGVPEQD